MLTIERLYELRHRSLESDKMFRGAGICRCEFINVGVIHRLIESTFQGGDAFSQLPDLG